MATYLELFTLRGDSDLQDRMAVACAIKAQILIDAGSLTANAKAWVNETLQSPVGKANEIINYVLAVNSSATIANIQGASDSALQSNVSDAVDALIA